MNQSSFGTADGSRASPAYSFISEPGTGLYRVSAGVLGVVIAGVEAARFSSLGVEMPPGQGLGGIVTQASTRSTGVTLSKRSGTITGDATSLAALALATYTVTNTLVRATDVIVLSKVSGDVDTQCWVNTVADGSFDITLRNTHATNADTTAFVLNFVLIKGSST